MFPALVLTILQVEKVLGGCLGVNKLGPTPEGLVQVLHLFFTLMPSNAFAEILAW